MRLDKFVAENTALSRREVKLLLKQGSVEVDGEIARNAAAHIAEDAQVKVDGELLEPIGLGYFMFHKPIGLVCANTDKEHETVFDYFDELGSEKMHIVGRLDIDTTGLVIITGDGKWSHRVTSPKRECEKSYLVSLAEPISDKAIAKLETGVFLGEEKRRTLPAKVEKLADDEIRLIISEGKYHQVKRMLEQVDNRVMELHRERIGDIILDPDLLEGEWRPLTEAEIASV